MFYIEREALVLFLAGSAKPGPPEVPPACENPGLPAAPVNLPFAQDRAGLEGRAGVFPTLSFALGINKRQNVVSLQG